MPENCEVIIVDNACIDNSIQEIQKKKLTVKIVKSDSNLGYAGGCNLGAKQSTGKFLLFLNDDTTHEKGWIEFLYNRILSDEKIGSVQPKILNHSNNKSFDYAGASGGFLDLLVYPYARGRIFNHIEEDNSQYDDDREIFWASGCAFMIRKDLFFRLGMFDQKLFAHMEEIDLHWKGLLSGYKNVVEPKSIIYHKGAQTLSEESFLKVHLNHRNSMILFFTNHNLIIMLALLIPKLLLEVISIIRYLFLGKIKCLFAQIYALLWVLVHPIYLISRIININKIKKLPLSSILQKMYKGSIVFNYYILGKKRYTDFN